ncbi:MAG: SCO family protein [Alphaproteobacteria bacterium]|nr:SCO family protein [Alphaproteobacteria bacterium]
MTPRLRLLFLGLIALAAVLATASVVLLVTRGGGAANAGSQIGGPFTLTGEDGQKVSDTDFRGRYMLLFFGFTHCPDVCPLTLQRIADALEAAPELKDKVTPVLISVDPERDTPAAMKEYVAYFGPTFRGLTGSPDEIAAVLAAYGVYARKVKLEGSALDYTVDHSSFIYLFGPDGAFLTVFDPQQDSAALAAKLKETVK